MRSFVLALDQGTTSSRAAVLDADANICAVAQQEIPQFYPKPGWVEHDPESIWNSQLGVARAAIQDAGVSASQVAAIGIANQRETTVIWSRTTGKPIYPAIVWQDRRTAGACDELRARGYSDRISQLTGLIVDSYFSATKIEWILDNVQGARAAAERGELAFGTIDSFLVWRLTSGRSHITDASNAGRTMLYDLLTGSWSDELLALFRVPSSLMPEISRSTGEVAVCAPDWFGVPIPICGIAGDQQAAMFGQGCVEPGMIKNTYGTGCFILCNTGESLIRSKHGLLTTLACSPNASRQYACEGGVFVGGAAVQWLRDEMKLIGTAAESEAVARSAPDSQGVYVVPAFAGLGAPHWDSTARGTIVGLTRGAGRSQIVRATLEGIAYQCREVVDAMGADLGHPIKELRVDGGASANNFLMQFQADILGIPVSRPRQIETTALGAALLAGQGVGLWSSKDMEGQRIPDRTFEPSISESLRQELYNGWQHAVRQARCR